MSKLGESTGGFHPTPLDSEIIERLFKKDIREGEEKLMLAVLANAVEYFQKYVLSRMKEERIYSKKRRSGF